MLILITAFVGYAGAYILHGVPDYFDSRRESYVANHVYVGMTRDELVQLLKRSHATWHSGYCLQEGQKLDDFGGDCRSNGATVQAIFTEFSSPCSAEGRLATFDFDTQGRLQHVDWTQSDGFSC